MPVRLTIHSSLVWTFFSRSAFVRTPGGTYDPSAEIFGLTIFIRVRRWVCRPMTNQLDPTGPGQADAKDLGLAAVESRGGARSACVYLAGKAVSQADRQDPHAPL